MLARWCGLGCGPAALRRAPRGVGARVASSCAAARRATAYAAARRTTINAHYTDPAIAAAIWQTGAGARLQRWQVLEPGCGSGTFIGLAPAGRASSPASSLTRRPRGSPRGAVPRGGHPRGVVRRHAACRTGRFDLAIGNVPFADVRLHDPRHNPAAHSLHNHFIVKSLALTRPGGLVAVLTSTTRLTRQPRRAPRDGRARATWSAPCGCRPARTAAPPAPTRSPTC